MVDVDDPNRQFDADRRPILELVGRVLYRGKRAYARVSGRVTLGVRVLAFSDAPGPCQSVVLVHHRYVDGWALPGGGVQRRETVPDAAVREFREETGLRLLEHPCFVGLFANFAHGGSDHVALFHARSWTGRPQADGIEIRAVRLFPVTALPPETTPATRRRIAEALGTASQSEDW